MLVQYSDLNWSVLNKVISERTPIIKMVCKTMLDNFDKGVVYPIYFEDDMIILAGDKYGAIRSISKREFTDIGEWREILIDELIDANV